MIGSVLSVAFVGIAGWWLVQVPPPPPEANLSFASTTVVASATTFDSVQTIATTPLTITVHVAGSVKNPGVYRLKYGSRINDGIVAAGGATSVANLDVINLATVLNEGEQIYVPKRGEKPHVITNRPQVAVLRCWWCWRSRWRGGVGGAPGAGGATNIATSPLININLASVFELEQLPGVGPATAKAIVAYRDKNGAFLKVEDLLKVRGIGPAKLSEILPRARVN